MIKIYIAGPYSEGDSGLNVRAAVLAADQIAEAGGFPFIPHLSHLWNLISPHEYEFWLKQDMAWLEVCDAVYRIGGKSHGSDREVARAKELGISVYYDLEILLQAPAREETYVVARN